MSTRRTTTTTASSKPRKASKPRSTPVTHGNLTISTSVLAKWYRQSNKGKFYVEGREPRETKNVFLFTDGAGGGGEKKVWTIAEGSLKSALKSVIRRVYTRAEKYDMSRFYEGLLKAQDGVYYVAFGS